MQPLVIRAAEAVSPIMQTWKRLPNLLRMEKRTLHLHKGMVNTPEIFNSYVSNTVLGLAIIDVISSSS